MSLAECSEECDDEPCTRGFLPEDELVETADQESEVLHSSNETSIIPGLNFISAGRVSSWQFAARGRQGSGVAVPHIQIWRQDNRVKRQSGVLYTFHDSTLLHEGKLQTHGDNMYSYRLESDMVIEAGDVVGVEQPEDSQLFLLFQRGGPINYITDSGSTEVSISSNQMRRLPLLRPEFHPSSESIQHVCG